MLTGGTRPPCSTVLTGGMIQSESRVQIMNDGFPRSTAVDTSDLRISMTAVL